MFELWRILLRKGKTEYWPYLIGSYELVNLCQKYTVRPLHYAKFSTNFFNIFSSKCNYCSFKEDPKCNFIEALQVQERGWATVRRRQILFNVRLSCRRQRNLKDWSILYLLVGLVELPNVLAPRSSNTRLWEPALLASWVNISPYSPHQSKARIAPQ